MSNRTDKEIPDFDSPADSLVAFNQSAANDESPPAPSSSRLNSSIRSPFPPSSFPDSSAKSPSKQPSLSSRHRNSHKSPPPLPAPPPESHSNGGDGGSNKAAIGAGIGIGLIIFIWMLICIIRWRRKKREEMYYDGDGKGANYGGDGKGANYGGYGKGANYGGDGKVANYGGDGKVANYGGDGKGSDYYYGKQYSNYNYEDQKGDQMRMNNNDFSYVSSMGQPQLQPPPPPISRGTITYEELEAATGGFDQKNMLGQGGFGYVHKGILSNGKEVAVKSLKANSGQGEQEFQTEVDVISRVHHRHLVSLVGYCISGTKRLLVYEFVPNQTLEYHLHGKGMPTMDWPTRLRIAIGSARGLAYLHEECPLRIIHRDIKGSNILLDQNFEPKVADFGLAKSTNDNNTHVSTRVMGTFGYLAPEYASSGRLTEKSDVYSFGVMLLELITGKQPACAVVDSYDQDGLVDWARPILNSGLQNENLRRLVDPFLEGNYNEQEMIRMAHAASASIRHSSKRRPKMSQIVKILEGAWSLEDLSSL